MNEVAVTINMDLIIWTLKFFFKFTFGLKIKKNIIKDTKWKKNLPQIAWVTGITVPRYFAVESIQTNIKKPPAANKITLIKDVCWGTGKINYITTPTCQGLNSSSP